VKRAIVRTILLLLLLTSGAFGQRLTNLHSTSAGLSKYTSVARQSPVLPQPTGKFGIGRVGFDWVDQKRPEPLSSQPDAHRELMVYLWYPTAPNRDNSARGTYLPGAKDIERASGSTRIKEQIFGHFWPLVVSGEITSHAKENAAPAKSKQPFPVILFSHGGSWTSFGYTALIEDLVSHGYVVAAIEHTYEAAAVVFADGRVISYSEENVRRMEKPPGASYDEMVENAMSWIRAVDDVFAADQRFALDQLVQLNRGNNKAQRFAGQFDLSNVAAMGHSMGGQASMRTCQLDERIKACVSLDGGSVDGVLIRYPQAAAPRQPMLYIEVPFMPLSEERLRQLHQTKEEWTQDWRARVQTQLGQCPGGSYYALLTSLQLSHLSFSDQPLLAAEGPTARQESLHHLQLIEKVIRTFTDKYLKGRSGHWIDQGSRTNGEVLVQHFGVSQHPPGAAH